MLPVAVPLKARLHYLDEIGRRVKRIGKFGVASSYPSSLAYEYAFCNQYIKALEEEGRLKGDMRIYVDYEEFVKRFDALPNEGYVYFDPDESEKDEYLRLKNVNLARNAAYEVSEEFTETPLTSVWLIGRFKWWLVILILFYASVVADFGAVLGTMSTLALVFMNLRVMYEVILLKFPELSHKRRVINLIKHYSVFVDILIDPNREHKVSILRSKPVYTRERRSKMWLEEMLNDYNSRTDELEGDEKSVSDELNNISKELESIGSDRLSKAYYVLLARVELLHDEYIEINLRRK